MAQHEGDREYDNLRQQHNRLKGIVGYETQRQQSRLDGENKSSSSANKTLMASMNEPITLNVKG